MHTFLNGGGLNPPNPRVPPLATPLLTPLDLEDKNMLIFSMNKAC